jgi:hypothetical protein
VGQSDNKPVTSNVPARVHIGQSETMRPFEQLWIRSNGQGINQTHNDLPHTDEHNFGSNVRVGDLYNVGYKPPQRKPIIIPQVFDGTTPWNDWFMHFKQCILINQWDEMQSREFLIVSLRRKALQIFQELPVDQRLHFYSLIKGLEEQFNPSQQAEMYKAQLRARVKNPRESLQDLHLSIQRLVERAYPNVSVKTRDEIAKDAFIDALPTDHDMRLQVRRIRPSNIHDALCEALALEAIYKAEDSTLESKNSKKMSVRSTSQKSDLDKVTNEVRQLKGTVEQLTRNVKTLMFQKQGVNSNDITSNHKNGSTDSKNVNIVCHFCHKSGHRKSQCFTLRNKLRREGKQFEKSSDENAKAKSVSQVHETENLELDLGNQDQDTSYKIGRSSVERGLFVPVELLDQSIDFLLDTGADITLLSIETWKNIPHELKPSLMKSDFKIYNVEGKPIRQLGIIEVPMYVGETCLDTRVYIADIQQKGIIGLDLIFQMGCILDFNSKCLVTSIGEVLPMKIFDKPPSVCRVSLCEKVSIPPKCEMILPGRKPDTTFKFGIVEPHYNLLSDYKLHVARTLIDSNASVIPVHVANVSDEVVSINKNSDIAIFSKNVQVDSELIQEDKNGNEILNESLTDLFERSKVHLNREQSRLLSQFLTKNQNVFSLHGELGKTDINTGDAPPIKIHPRRLSPADREEAEKQIAEMLEAGVIQPSISPW